MALQRKGTPEKSFRGTVVEAHHSDLLIRGKILYILIWNRSYRNDNLYWKGTHWTHDEWTRQPLVLLVLFNVSDTSARKLGQSELVSRNDRLETFKTMPQSISAPKSFSLTVSHKYFKKFKNISVKTISAFEIKKNVTFHRWMSEHLGYCEALRTLKLHTASNSFNEFTVDSTTTNSFISKLSIILTALFLVTKIAKM